ncbi:uncharacterized protein LOC9657016 isoform X1 [Selaginella moellendorffii]|uniref:uncharacterized protein LOC9657016 isoform X1 n=1 Tax=Selaginella moellendorffii TaxID=88036 RepID=UPI000D1C2EBC|nr:uncharacterized protein LOC9657016 isoform X1 [Selaginella moellendorffii]|eukprot:XP_024541658.1 uncharacterized protein LOC9657016 isoform X1 [Selaginella moellendorffii]
MLEESHHFSSMPSSSLVLPILFQLSAFCPLETDFNASFSRAVERGHPHHRKPDPSPPAPPEHGSYDQTAFSECLAAPTSPLYNGGVLKNPAFDADLLGWSPFGGCTLKIQVQGRNKFLVATNRNAGFHGPSQALANLTQGSKYTLSAWLQVNGGSDDTAPLVKATIKANGQYISAGSVAARNKCWTFLKGGFIPEFNASSATLYFEVNLTTLFLCSPLPNVRIWCTNVVQSSDPKVDIWLDSVSLQPFSDEEWSKHQDISIKKSRTRSVTLSVTDCKGHGIHNADIQVEQITGDFPFGSAIASTILDNPTYQKWFVTRFNTAVFENEMKWYSTERQQGKVSYETADKMLDFCKANNILVRGHNVLWNDPQYQPGWVKDLSASELRTATMSRIESVMSHYAGKLPQWDVLNEMLHFNFFESKLGSNAAVEIYKFAQEIDPETTLFLNDFNVIEVPQDSMSLPDNYVHRLLEMKAAGIKKLGIGLEGHFSGKPNLVYMRAVLDKLATLELPIWLTEVDIMNSVDSENQAIYLQQVLREAFSHPAVKGIVLWTALHPYGCYRMCLTDQNFKNLPAGNIVDVFLKNIRTVGLSGTTDHEGSFSFQGFHGEYEISVTHNRTSVIKRLAIGPDTDSQTIHVLVS